MNAKLTKEKAQQLVERSNLFAQMKPGEITKLLNAGMLVHRNPGEAFFEKGQRGEEMYVVLSGKVTVVDEYAGQQKVMAELGLGDIFGEMGAFGKGERSATVRAREDTIALVIDHHGLQNLVKKRIGSKFLLNVIMILCNRLRVTNAHYLHAKYADGSGQAPRKIDWLG